MPITKLPVVHKFGIISSSQRLELQERLLKQTYLSTLKTNKASTTKRNQYEVTEEFVQMFNAAMTFDEKESFEEKARKLLERSKRRSGVKHCGYGEHVNLPLSWTEMAQLAQCKGRIQEDCLNALVTSLDVSPVEKYHIPALFFLAETMLYWLRTEAIHQPFLRTAEIKLLKMGQLVFQRLFYHHMAGQLQGHNESKNRLFTYIDGLQECQEAYNPYPNALLSLRFIIEVGKIILADSQLEPGDIKEGDKIVNAPRHNMEELTSSTKELYEQHNHDDARSIHSGAISSSVHDLSPTLWHALDVWRCTNSLGGGLREALKALAHCGLGLASETWVDGIVAIEILGETAKSNMSAIKVLHRLAQGVKTTEDLMTPPLSSRSGQSDMFSISSEGNEFPEEENNDKLNESCESYYSSKQSLSDIYERSEEGEGDKKIRSLGDDSTENDNNSMRKDEQTDVSQEGGSEVSVEMTANNDDANKEVQGKEKSPEHVDEEKPKTALRESGGLTKSSLMREVSFDEAAMRKTSTSDFLKSSQESRFQDSKLSQPSFDTDRGTGWKAEFGSENKSGRASDTSSVQTFTNMPLPDTPGITGWHWEVAFTYTDVLANVVLYGSTADIQKHALVGNNIDLDRLFRHGNNNTNISIGSGQLSSAGLLDLAFFKPRTEASDKGPNDWSWRIRFGAIQSLVKVCHCLEGDANRDGLRTTAWNVLLRAHAIEKDNRVLEALKVGQVQTKDKEFLDSSYHTSPSTLGKRMATGLSSIYLPPLPPPVAKSTLKQVPRHRIVVRPKAPIKGTQRKPLRTSLKQEIELATALYEQAPDYNTRTSFDLRRVVEDQWRKELQKNLEDEEEAELKRLKTKQKEEEEKQREIAAEKVKKFQKKSEIKQPSVQLGIPGKETPLGNL